MNKRQTSAKLNILMGEFFFHLVQIMMSSGGMLLEKLNAEDPQLTKMEPFDGVTAYSQEKVRLCHSAVLFIAG